jgi:hypothetical protein
VDEGEQLLAQLLWGHRAVDEGGDGEVDLVLALEAILRRAARFSGHGACFCEQLPQPLPRLLADVSIAGEATGHQVEEASMFGGVRAFSSFAVDDSAAASKFYGEMLGLRVSEEGGALMAALGR